MSEVCQDCGCAYDEIYHLPDEIWRKISPKGNEGGLLCMHCAEVRAWRCGVLLYWEGADRAFPSDAFRPSIVR